MQRQFRRGERVQVTTGTHQGVIGVVRKVKTFGLGGKPFVVEIGTNHEAEFDHGELSLCDD